jgi:tetratricopeptide (TPR) repeat protein
MPNIKTIFFVLLLANIVSLSHARAGMKDSLLQKLYTTNDDSARADLLIALSKKYYTIHIDSAFDFAKQGLAIAKNLHYNRGIANALYQVSVGYFQKQNNKMAVLNCNEAKSYFEQLQDKGNEGKCWMLLGSINSREGKYEKALELYNFAEKSYETSGKKSEIPSIWNNIGNNYARQANYSKALEYLTKAKNGYNTSGNTARVMFVLSSIGEIYMNEKKYNEAIKHYREGLEIEKDAQLTYPQLVANINGQMSETFVKMNRLDSALLYAEKAKKIAAQMNDWASVANYTHDAGKIYNTQNNPEQALRNFMDALKHYETLGSALGIAEVCKDISKSYEKTNDWNSSIMYGERAYELARSNNQVEIIQEICETLSIVYEKQGKKDKVSFHKNNILVAKELLATLKSAPEEGQEMITFIEKQKDFDAKNKPFFAKRDSIWRSNSLKYIIGIFVLCLLSVCVWLYSHLKKS